MTSRADRQERINGVMSAGADRVLPAASTLADEIDQLANRVNLNTLGRLSPERWHVERNDIVVSLRRIARKLRGETRREPSTVWRA